MALMPMAAMVPTTVAMVAATKATTRLSASASRIISLCKRLLYHLKVKPVNRVRLLLVEAEHDHHGDRNVHKREDQAQIDLCRALE